MRNINNNNNDLVIDNNEINEEFGNELREFFQSMIDEELDDEDVDY